MLVNVNVSVIRDQFFFSRVQVFGYLKMRNVGVNFSLGVFLVLVL